MDVKIPHELYEIHPWTFVVKLLILGGIVSLCVGTVLVAQGLVALPAQIVLGIMYAHAVELQHQCLHGTAFRGKRLNRVVGIFLGLPMLVSWAHYRARHLWHHWWVGTPQDTEFFSYARGFNSWTSLLRQAFSLHRYRGVFRHMRDALCGRACPDARKPEEARHIRQEYLLMAALLVAAGLCTVGFRSTLLLELWLVPLLVSAEATHYLIELPEHFHCDPHTQDVLLNTRTIVGSPFSRWLTNGNNFHVEHHYHAGVPIDQLAALHPLLAPHMHYLVPSYWAFYSSLLPKGT
jgi:fatty acid desaturase